MTLVDSTPQTTRWYQEDAWLELLGIITSGIAFGHFLSVSPHRMAVIHLFEACLEALVAMIKVITLFTPLRVGSVVAGSIATSNGSTSGSASNHSTKRIAGTRL